MKEWQEILAVENGPRPGVECKQEQPLKIGRGGKRQWWMMMRSFKRSKTVANTRSSKAYGGRNELKMV